VTFVRSLAAITAVALLGIPGCATGPAARSAKPNVVVIMTDDQAVESLRVMRNTKRLIADRGVTFENSFVSFPLCCPSRATFLTGRYGHAHRVLGNRAPLGGHARFDDSDTLPVWLKRRGYRTALVGKYLNGYGEDDPKEVPPGWTDWYGIVDPSTRNFYHYKINDNGKVVTYGHPRLHRASHYVTPRLSRKVQSVIRSASRSDSPFFVWASFTAPHEGNPIEPDDAVINRSGLSSPAREPRYMGRFKDESLPRPPSFDEKDVSDKPPWVRKARLRRTVVVDTDEGRLRLDPIEILTKRYQQELEALLSVDDAVGNIIDTLEETGELQDTVIVFTSDNGFIHGEHRLIRGKLFPYEPAIRVPLIMRGPGMPEGKRAGELVSNIDLAPTIADLTGARAGRRVDGRSLVPLAEGRTTRWRDEIYLEGVPQDEEDVPMFFGVRTRRYVYIEFPTERRREAYDLTEDPDQLRNVASDRRYRQALSRLHKRLVEFYPERHQRELIALVRERESSAQD
jgi:N-acetylglucosamine-6-sulfatase